jgi:5'-3' exonuclease
MNKQYEHMLVDGKNTVYRSLFAGHADQNFKKSGHDPFVVFLRFLNHYVNRFHPQSVHVFWDAPSGSVWRRGLYPEYKMQRTDMYGDYDFDVRAEVRRQMAIALETLNVMNVRQYFREEQEADDLVYAFVLANPDTQKVIVSSDGDFSQILYRHTNVDLFSPSHKSMIEKPAADPVILKSLIGDVSDNISGYNQIGKARAKPLTESPELLEKFLKSEKANIIKDGKKEVVGDQVFNLNKKIIDLSQCPAVLDNIEYVRQHQTSKVKINLTKVTEIARRRKVNGLISEFPATIPSFQRLT